jgi:hypothetical protein
MRFVIDGETARSSCVGTRFATPRQTEGAVKLSVTPQRQLFDNWCWAAIASVLGRYYGTSAASQSEIASHLLRLDCAGIDGNIDGDDELRVRADAEMRLDAALALVGCYSHWSAGKPLFDRVRFEINLGRPFAARIEWQSGGAHYVLVRGYRDEGKRIIVADPLHGEAEYPLFDFPSRYQLGGAWTETFWTNPAGRAGHPDPRQAAKDHDIEHV